MTTPYDAEVPQPRDIAVEQESAELAADLDQQSDSDARETPDRS